MIDKHGQELKVGDEVCISGLRGQMYGGLATIVTLYPEAGRVQVLLDSGTHADLDLVDVTLEAPPPARRAAPPPPPAPQDTANEQKTQERAAVMGDQMGSKPSE